MLDYYKNVWANIRKKYPTVKTKFNVDIKDKQSLQIIDKTKIKMYYIKFPIRLCKNTLSVI